jgi:hypothetical protein
VLADQRGRLALERAGYDLRTTMIYTHAPNRGSLGVCSPIDGL